MRLICGVLSFESDIAGASLLPPMCEAMQSPTRRATVSLWSDGPAALAVMDFTEQAAARSHAIPRNGDFPLAADIRLDNRNELRNTLGLPAASDSHLAFGAFEKWGLDAPTHLLGDFALACFDRNQRTLTLARDIFGIRPLAYHHAPGCHVVFASLPRGLFPSGLVPQKIDPLAIAHQIQLRFSAEDTLFRNVRMLSPAHTVIFSSHGERTHRYWQPTLQPNRHRTPQSAAIELRSLLDTAIHCRMPTTGPVAAHLSGGIDSSAICAFASRALHAEGSSRAVHGFSFWPEERPGIEYERPFVESILKHDPSILCHPIQLESSGALSGTRLHPDRLLSLSDSDPENAISKQAAALGSDTILSGWGGDEGATFNGRGVLAQSLLTLRWGYLFREMNALRNTRGWSKTQVLAGEIMPFFIPDAVRQMKDTLFHRQRQRNGIWSELLQPSIITAILARDKMRPLRMGPRASANQLALLRSGHLSWRATNWATLGAHYGVAFAFPLLDRRVIDLVLSVPPQWHLRGGFKRRLIRDATEGLLPDSIRWRHNKITPFPLSDDQVQAQRDDIVQHVRELAISPAVAAVFRTDKLLALAESLAPSESGNSIPSAATVQTLLTISSVLGYCSFLDTSRGC